MGGVVFLSSGDFPISTSLLVDSTAGVKYVSFKGVGATSSLIWGGAESSILLKYDGGGLLTSGSMLASIESLRFANGLNVEGPITASKSATTVTKTAGRDFLASDVNKTIVWDAPNSTDDLITAYISETQVTVSASATIASQTATLPNDLKGMIGLRIGKPNPGNTGILGACNLTVHKCEFDYFGTPIEIWPESDQVTIDDNWIFVYTSAGIYSQYDPAYTSGGGNGVLRVINNQLQGGQDGSIGVITNGAVQIIKGNNIQSGRPGNGIWLRRATAFSVENNYSEMRYGGPTASRYFVRAATSYVGRIGENQMGGYGQAAALIDIAADCHDIEIGPNFHADSGPLPTVFVQIATGAENIRLTAKQYSSSASVPLLSGAPSSYVGNFSSDDHFSKTSTDNPASLFSLTFGAGSGGCQVVVVYGQKITGVYNYYGGVETYDIDFVGGTVTVNSVSSAGSSQIPAPTVAGTLVTFKIDGSGVASHTTQVAVRILSVGQDGAGGDENVVYARI